MADESSIPAPVAEKARFYGVKIEERDDDFVATSDKIMGQQFEAMTAASAVRNCLKEMGIDYDAPIASESLAHSNLSKVAEKVIEAPTTLEQDNTKAPRKPRPSELKKKAERDAVKAAIKNVSFEPAPQPIEQVTASGKEKAVARATKQAAKPHAGKTVAQAVAESPKQDPASMSEPEPKGNVTSLASERAKRSSAPANKKPAPKPAAKTLPVLEKELGNVLGGKPVKPAAKPVAEPKAKPAAKAKGKAKATAKPKAAPAARPKLDPSQDNGNGRPRGKRWAVKNYVLGNPKMAPEDIFTELEKKGIDSKVQSISSIRMDFLATLRAAKELGKLKKDVAARVPDARVTNRNSSNVLRVINKAVILHPDLDPKALADHIKKAGEIDTMALQKAGPISASRAAIIESITVMKEAGALR